MACVTALTRDSAAGRNLAHTGLMALQVRVCKLVDIVDNELRAFKVKGVTWPVLVTRVDGEILATAGVCPHEDVELVDGGDRRFLDPLRWFYSGADSDLDSFDFPSVS